MLIENYTIDCAIPCNRLCSFYSYKHPIAGNILFQVLIRFGSLEIENQP